jgi:hypothetical protein
MVADGITVGTLIVAANGLLLNALFVAPAFGPDTKRAMV